MSRNLPPEGPQCSARSSRSCCTQAPPRRTVNRPLTTLGPRPLPLASTLPQTSPMTKPTIGPRAMPGGFFFTFNERHGARDGVASLLRPFGSCVRRLRPALLPPVASRFGKTWFSSARHFAPASPALRVGPSLVQLMSDTGRTGRGIPGCLSRLQRERTHFTACPTAAIPDPSPILEISTI